MSYECSYRLWERKEGAGLVRWVGLEPRPLVGWWYQPAHLGRQFSPALQVCQKVECDGDRIEMIPVR